MAVKDRPLSKAADERAEELRALRAEFAVAAKALEELAARQAEESRGTTVNDLAAQAGVPEEALVAFARTAGTILEGRPLSAQAARRAAALATAEQVWEGEIGPLLSSAQVGDLLGGVSRQRVNELLRTKRLIGMHDSAGRLWFPAFKFRDRRPLQPIVRAYWTLLDEGRLSEWSAASWCAAPDTALDGHSPAQWAHEDLDPERLAKVARHDAARLSR